MELESLAEFKLVFIIQSKTQNQCVSSCIYLPIKIHSLVHLFTERGDSSCEDSFSSIPRIIARCGI